MAVIKTEGGYNALPISYKRGNPIPLDKTEIWYDYNLMAEYAASNPVAYVGQILGLVDQINNTATAYIILNTAGDLQEVGGTITVDDTSLSLNDDGAIALKYWGVQYYKYISASIDEETGENIEAGYELQIVDEKNPWKAGLEPKVALEDGSLVLAWYEPNPTTIEGLGGQIGTLQTTVDDLIDTTTSIQEEIGNPADDTNSATGLYAELDKKANIDNVYTKEEVQQQIAAADHLKRKKVANLEEAEEYISLNDDAEQYIYMIPTGLQYDDDKYDEYIVIDGKLEKVGSWEVDLKDYVTKDSLNNTLQEYATNEILESNLETKVDIQEGYGLVPNDEISKLRTVKENAEENYIKSVDSHFTVSETKELQLNPISITDVKNLESLLAEKVDKIYYTVTNEDGSTQQVEGTLLSPSDKDKLSALVIGDSGGVEISGKVNASNVEGLAEWITNNRETVSGLFSIAAATKLDSIEAGAEKNFIRGINTTEFNLDENGTLSLANISAQKITNLSDDFIYAEDIGLSLAENYVTSTIYTAEVGDLTQLLKATPGEGSTTLVNEINYINQRLAWQELKETV